MIKWYLRRWIAKFERTWSYDASYVRDILDADPRALLIFGKVTSIGGYEAGRTIGAGPRPRPDQFRSFND